MTYKAFPEITIPAWLEPPVPEEGEEAERGWEDTSWGNDALAKSQAYLKFDPEGEAHVITVWVNYADVSEREVPPGFQVVVDRNQDEWDNDTGITLYQGEDSEAARWAVHRYLVNWAVEGIKADIKTGWASTYPGIATAKTFSELHDYCDANILGPSEAILETFGGDYACDVMNDAHDIVNDWLANGRE